MVGLVAQLRGSSRGDSPLPVLQMASSIYLPIKLRRRFSPERSVWEGTAEFGKLNLLMTGKMAHMPENYP
jgi:hypothetical protein